MVKEGFAVGRKEAWFRSRVGSEIQIASVSKRIAETEDGVEWTRR